MAKPAPLKSGVHDKKTRSYIMSCIKAKNTIPVLQGAGIGYNKKW
jgi:hypothetical protein